MANALETHQSLLENKLRRLWYRFAPSIAKPSFTISVSSGLHQGFERLLEGSTIRIGGDEASDLVLLDETIKADHAVLQISRSILGEVVRVSTDYNDVALNGTPVQPSVESPVESLPVHLHIGGVDLELRARQEAAPNGGARRRRPKTDRGMILAGLATVVVAGALVINGAAPGSLDAKNYSVQLNPKAPRPIEASGTFLSPSELEGALRERIEDAGLARYLDVKAVPATGALQVEGVLPRGKRRKWREIHQWFDGQTFAPLLRTRIESAPMISDFPSIALVRLAEPVQVQFINGNRVGIGDVVQDRWVLTQVNETGISLERDGEVLTIGF